MKQFFKTIEKKLVEILTPKSDKKHEEAFWANWEMFREIKKSDPRNPEFIQAMEAFIKDDETAVIKALLQHIYKHG